MVSPSLGKHHLTSDGIIEADSVLDSSLRDVVERILPLGTYYTAISAFIDSRSHLEYGLVNHALCAAIRDMLKVRYAFPPSIVRRLLKSLSLSLS